MSQPREETSCSLEVVEEELTVSHPYFLYASRTLSWCLTAEIQQSPHSHQAAECLVGRTSRLDGHLSVDILIYYVLIPEVQPLLHQVPTISDLLRPLHTYLLVM